MHIFVLTLLALASFSSQKTRQRLIKVNSALRKAVKSLEGSQEDSVGGPGYNFQETAVGPLRHGYNFQEDSSWPQYQEAVGGPGEEAAVGPKEEEVAFFTVNPMSCDLCLRIYGKNPNACGLCEAYKIGKLGGGCEAGAYVTTIEECREAVEELRIFGWLTGDIGEWDVESVSTSSPGCSIVPSKDNTVPFNSNMNAQARDTEVPICRKEPIPEDTKERVKDTEERVRHVVASLMVDVGPSDLSIYDRFVEDLGAEEEGKSAIIEALEEEFETAIPENYADQITTIGQAIEFMDTVAPTLRENP